MARFICGALYYLLRSGRCMVGLTANFSYFRLLPFRRRTLVSLFPVLAVINDP